MIREIILTTQNTAGETHIAPMGVHEQGDLFLVLPFRPSKTLDNLRQTGQAVMNFTDDVRIFAGCLTGRKQWPLTDEDTVNGKRLQAALAHKELRLQEYQDDEVRPRLLCSVEHAAVHAPFDGFNRAQFSVLEAAILVSRLERLEWPRIRAELDYLQIGLDKTAGPAELEAWDWLMQRVETFKQENPLKVTQI